MVRLYRPGYTESSYIVKRVLCDSDNSEIAAKWKGHTQGKATGHDMHWLYLNCGLYDKKYPSPADLKTPEAFYMFEYTESFREWYSLYYEALEACTYSQLLSWPWAYSLTEAEEACFSSRFTCVARWERSKGDTVRAKKKEANIWRNFYHAGECQRVIDLMADKRILIINNVASFLRKQVLAGNRNPYSERLPTGSVYFAYDYPTCLMGQGPDSDHVETIKKVVDKAVKFKPDLCLISAGAHAVPLAHLISEQIKCDVVNMGSQLLGFFGVFPGRKQKGAVSSIPKEYIPTLKVSKDHIWKGQMKDVIRHYGEEVKYAQ